jgi:hypothetical protein
MPLQNRVAPDGSLHAVSARGMFTGNRGIIHDPHSKTLSGKRWTTRSWIVCACEWKGVRREPWGRNHVVGDGERRAGWTELFFLDEVTALAAGHRPCFACRRADATSFRAGLGELPSLQFIDRALHGERRVSSRLPLQRISAIDLPGLPDGTVVQSGEAFFALRDRRALPWSFSGYGKSQGLGDLLGASLSLVTPRTMLKALKSGYRPVWHGSAG